MSLSDKIKIRATIKSDKGVLETKDVREAVKELKEEISFSNEELTENKTGKVTLIIELKELNKIIKRIFGEKLI